MGEEQFFKHGSMYPPACAAAWLCNVLLLQVFSCCPTKHPEFRCTLAFWQVRDGIGYLPAAVRDVRLAVLRAQREGGSDVGADGVRRDGIALVKQPDIDFTAQLRADVDAWLKVWCFYCCYRV